MSTAAPLPINQNEPDYAAQVNDRLRLLAAMKEQAKALIADKPWQPSAGDLQRGRTLALRLFSDPHNLSVADFAERAGKARQIIDRDIASGRLLALRVGARQRRIPDWQLDPAQLKLTQKLMKEHPEVDPWTWFDTLTARIDAWNDRTALQVVRNRNIDEITDAVLNLLGFH